jgi:hypothetical protein
VRRHDLDLTSLVAGLVFVGIAVAYLVGAYTKVRIDAGWVLPFGLVGLGLAGLGGTLRAGLRSGDQDSVTTSDHAPGDAAGPML